MVISEPGCYRGCVVEHAVSMTSSGIPQFEAKLRATEKYDFDTQVSYVFAKDGKPGPVCDKLYHKLIAIQCGDEPDTHGWVTVLD